MRGVVSSPVGGALIRKVYMKVEEELEQNLIDEVNKCQHEDAEVIQPCCTTPGSSGYIECGCAGLPYVECLECNNEQLTEEDIEEILKGAE